MAGEPTSAAGAYDHLDWTLNAGTGDQAWTSSVASIHETCHADLNQSTAYGALLSGQAYLARETGSDFHTQQLNSLTQRCRNTHEIYATSIALMISADTGVHLQKFTKAYPEYATYLTQADALLVGLKSRSARMHALAAVTKTCFQAPVVNTAVEAGIANFKVSDARHRDFPDSRLATLAPRLNRDFWHRCIDDFSQSSGDKDGLRNLLNAEGDGPDQIVADNALASEHFEPFSVSFSLYLEDQIGKLLDELGLGYVRSVDYQTYTNAILQQCNEIHPFVNSVTPLRSASSGLTGNKNALDTQFSETLIVGPRIPAEVKLFNQLPRPRWDDYLTRTEADEVFFIASRTKERFCKQYDVDTDGKKNLDAIADDYVVYLVKASNRAEKLCAKICILDQPRQLEAIDCIAKRGMLASTSMLLLADKNWQNDWHSEVSTCATQTVLFDLSPLVHLERTLDAKFANVSFKKFSLQALGRKVSCVVFAGRSDKFSSVFVAPCNEVVADGIIHFARSSFVEGSDSQAIWREGGSTFDDLALPISITLQHLLTHERSFDFKAIKSQYGAKGFQDGRFS